MTKLRKLNIDGDRGVGDKGIVVLITKKYLTVNFPQ